MMLMHLEKDLMLMLIPVIHQYNVPRLNLVHATVFAWGSIGHLKHQ